LPTSVGGTLSAVAKARLLERMIPAIPLRSAAAPFDETYMRCAVVATKRYAYDVGFSVTTNNITATLNLGALAQAAVVASDTLTENVYMPTPQISLTDIGKFVGCKTSIMSDGPRACAIDGTGSLIPPHFFVNENDFIDVSLVALLGNMSSKGVASQCSSDTCAQTEAACPSVEPITDVKPCRWESSSCVDDGYLNCYDHGRLGWKGMCYLRIGQDVGTLTAAQLANDTQCMVLMAAAIAEPNSTEKCLSFALSPDESDAAIVGAFNVTTSEIINLASPYECDRDATCYIACRFGLEFTIGIVPGNTNGDDCTTSYITTYNSSHYGMWGTHCQEDIIAGHNGRCCLNETNEDGVFDTMQRPTSGRRRRLASAIPLKEEYQLFQIRQGNAATSQSDAKTPPSFDSSNVGTLAIVGGLAAAAIIIAFAVPRRWRHRRKVAAQSNALDEKEMHAKRNALDDVDAGEPETRHPPPK
jgi:hypothetical protein